tara:strand:- start:18 stop:917 length:900 start_codon:yes stop_codon:yes gene_type:complete
MEETINNQTDTPEQGPEQLSVEEAFFQSVENEGGNTEAPKQDTPQSEGLNVEETQAKNDDKRFEYWQSQASLAANENAQLKAQMQNVAQGMAQQQQAQAQQAQEETQQFPDAPEKPQMPAGFNRAEANEDPSSVSAQYLNNLENWRDDSIQYNALKSEYQTALVQERLEAEQAQRVQNIQRAQAYNTQKQQLNGVYQEVQGKHGLTPEEASEFMQTMSNPQSLTIDNLVQVYRMQKGSGQQPQTQVPAQPSDTFNQQARAQQVPSPMGVIPAQQNETGGNTEDNIMDSMISGYKKSNPW